MQHEPVQFGAVAAARARRSAAGFTRPVRTARQSTSDSTVATVLDEAFADFTRLDSPSPAPNASTPSMSQALMANIATQLEVIDNQRRQLARLLETVDSNTTV